MQGFGTVKSVLSGDTVILMGNSTRGSAPEMQLSLAFCQAPRVARSAEGLEESYGWQSREFLRKMVIGQVVKFKVLYKVDAISRTFGTLELKGKNVITEMVSNGMVSVRDERDDHGQKDLYEELIELQAAARNGHKGMWSSKLSSRSVIWTLPDPEAFFKANKGFPLAGIIEQVRDGSTFKLYLPEGGEFITLHLAGIQSPRITYSPTGEATYEAHSQEARSFSEIRLLNRSVLIYIDGMDKFNNFFGRIEHPKGNITIELLKAGLSRVVDWSANFLPNSDIAELRSAEVAAKQQHLCLWKEWKPASTSYDSIDGQVLQVLSGDTLIILLNDKSPIYMGSQRRVNLASIKAPKMGNAKKNVPDEPWAQEAKEALMKLAVGRKVKMTVEYDRTVTTTSEEATYTFCTVILEGKNPLNLGEEMVKRGLVTVVRHRQDDPRAENYDQLLIAEDKAKAAKKGMYGKASPRLMRRVDYSETPTKAKTSFHFLTEQKQHQGIIEYVFSAAHYLVYLPSENCQFSLTLQGIKAPQSSAKGKAESFGDESLMYAKYNYLQRSVVVEVNNCDKVGNYIGDIFMPNDKNPISLSLLRNGVCYVNENSIDFCSRAEEMERQEEEAKSQRKGYWMNFKPEEKPKETAVKGEMDVLMTYVKTGNTFFVNSSLDKANVTKVNTALNALPVHNDLPVVKPVKTTVYACLDHSAWVRVRILNMKGNALTVKAIDKGYDFETTSANLRELDDTIRSVPALARECILAGVEVPPTGTWSVDSRNCFDDLADDLCHARVVLRDASNRLAVFLYREKETTSINEMMLSEGWGRLEKNAYTRYAGYNAILDSMKRYESEAKEDRVGIYERGDIGFGDE